MKAISDQLYTALIQNLCQLPMGQVEGLVSGLRSALDVPKPIAEDLQRQANLKARQDLLKRLEALPQGAEIGQRPAPPNGENKVEQPPKPKANGESEQAPGAAAAAEG